jgi:hypothetical protein
LIFCEGCIYYINLGNQCDQRFSILANEFKAEITTIEDLKDKIMKAPMTPKAICRSLLYIFGWKSFITDHLTDPPLENHSKFNSFLISLEGGEAKLRAKKLPQDSHLVPRAAIRLLKEGHAYGPVLPAEFRIEKLNFDQIMKGLRIYMFKMPLEERMRIQTSWDNLRSTLEGLPKQSANLEKMVLTDLPKQTEEVPTLPEHLLVVDDTPQLKGDLFPEEIDFGHLEDEVAVGMDVCIYTEDRKWRPWLGRIVKILTNKRFLLQWYSRKSVRSSVFTALNNSDGSPSLAELDNEMVMFWMMSEPQSRTVTSFSLTPYWLQTIQREYEEIDRK